MNSTTNVILDLQAPNIAVITAGKQNDRMSRQIVCQLRDGAVAFTPPVGVSAMIRYSKPDGTAGFYDVMEDETTPAYTISGSMITIKLCEQMLTVAGNVWVEINFYTTTERLTTFYFLLEVQASVLTDATIVSSDYYNVLTAQIQALLGATTNPPKIDPNTKNWLLWDENTGVYVDSGYSSVGTQGPTGPQGVSVTSVTKASGTSAPGTTDTYDVNLSNNTVAGQFSVYNGSDGTGAPGSATPLSDSGSGVVGTAPAFSREDHRHPLNVPTSGTPEKDGTASRGTASTYARSDHVHSLNVDTTNPASLGTAAPGTASSYARRDHVHPMPTAASVGAMNTWTLLWTNASPTSEFDAQTISLDLSGYDYIAVEHKVYASVDQYRTDFGAVGTAFGLIQLSGGTGYSASASNQPANRLCTANTSSIVFGDGYRSNSGSSSYDLQNGRCIPTRIWGIKGVQTA